MVEANCGSLMKYISAPLAPLSWVVSWHPVLLPCLHPPATLLAPLEDCHKLPLTRLV